MRRSSSAHAAASQIPRRSSSIDPNSWNGLGSSQPQASSQQFQRQSVGRASSIGLGRASSIGIGRPSILNAKGASEAKPPNVNEIAQSVVQVVNDELQYAQPLTVKSLMLPSTATFYQLFEYLLKFLGVSDVWNSNIIAAQMLLQSTQAGNNNNNNPPASQQQANSAVAQNKARIETILYYLSLLRYNNLPKANVLQTMTTPKNWLWMLQILQFLANDCKFYMINDASKLMYAFRADNEILHEFLKKTYVQTLYDSNYLKTERHAKLKEESLDQFAQQLRAGYNLDHLKAETESIRKDYEFLKSTENELENMLEEEKELARELAEEERLAGAEAAAFDEQYKGAKAKKKELNTFKDKMKKDEEILKVKDTEYDRQLASGKQLDKLPAKHSQKLQELEQLQNEFVDLEKEIEDLQGKVLSHSHEVKETIDEVNSLVSKIKLSSSIPLEEFPQVELIDFHRKIDMIKPYKEGLLRLREKHNAELCKLPELLLQLREEKKACEAKKEAFKVKNETLEKENKKLYEHKSEMLKSSLMVFEDIKLKLSQSRARASEIEEELKTQTAIYNGIRADFERLVSDHKKIEAEIEIELKSSKESAENAEKTACKSLQDRMTDLQAHYKRECQGFAELTNRVQNYTNIVRERRQQLANRKLANSK